MKKSINLKKQLAFISSLALIAGTAVYMPANAGEILGIGTSISVSAYNNTASFDEFDISYETDAGLVKFHDIYLYDSEIVSSSEVRLDIDIPDDIRNSRIVLNNIEFRANDNNYQISNTEIILDENGKYNDKLEITSSEGSKISVSFNIQLFAKYLYDGKGGFNEISLEKSSSGESKDFKVTYEKSGDKYVRVYNIYDATTDDEGKEVILGFPTDDKGTGGQYQFTDSSLSSKALKNSVNLGEEKEVFDLVDTDNVEHISTYGLKGPKCGNQMYKLPGEVYLDKANNQFTTDSSGNTLIFANRQEIFSYNMNLSANAHYIPGLDGKMYLVGMNGSGEADETDFSIGLIGSGTGSYVKTVFTEPEKVTVTFDANGGHFYDNSTSMNADIVKDRLVTIAEYMSYRPSRTGYKFDGWLNDNDHAIMKMEAGGSQATFFSEGTVYANWIANKYTLRIAPNFDGETITVGSDFSYGQSYVIDTKDYPALNKKGWKFLGLGKTYHDSEPVFPVDSEGKIKIINATEGTSVTLYALFEEATGPSIKLDGKTLEEISEPVLKDENAANSASNPYIMTADINNAAYGSSLKYEFVPADGTASISGSKGTVKFNSNDGSAETGIYRVSIDGTETYFQVKFIQLSTVSDNCGDITANKSSFTYNNNTEEKDTELTIESADKIELVDGNYVKNYNVALPATIKAKSKVTVSLSELMNGYETGTTDNKFDVTLGEDGTASKIVKISSTWDGNDIVEYVKFNFALENTFDDDTLTFDGVGNESYSTSYITDGNRYVKVYTVRDAVGDDGKITVLGVTLTALDGESAITENVLTFKDGSSQTAIVNDTTAPCEYIKVVYNPVYTLDFYDGDKLIASHEETVGGKYVLPENPTKEGYTFAGWKLENGTAILQNQPVKQADGLKAYAQWSPIRYTVKLDANGGTAATSALGEWNISNYGTSVQKTNVAYDTTDKLTAGTSIVKKDGYELIGFSTDKNAKTPDENLSFLNEKDEINADAAITFDKLTSKSGSTVTLYAVWRAESKSLIFTTEEGVFSIGGERLISELSGLKIEGDQQFTDIKAAVDSKIGELPKAALKGYTFKGWCTVELDGEEVVKSVTMITPDTIFTNELAGRVFIPYFEINTYNVNYEDITITDEKAPSVLAFDAYGGFGFLYDSSDFDSKASTTGYIESEKSGYNLLGYTVNGIVKDATQKEETESKYFTLAEIEGLLQMKSTPLTYKTSDGKTAAFSVDAADITIKAVWAVDENSGLINVDYDDAVISYKNAKGNTISVKPTSSTYSKFPSVMTGKPGDRITYNCDIDGEGIDNITFTDYGFDVDDVECTLSKDGYVFAGWFFKDANGKEKAFTNTKFTAGVTNVYAKWTAESKLTAPTNVKVSKDGTVTWTKSEGAAYYRVYKVYNGITKNAKTTSSPYTFQNLATGVEHEVYVVAFDAKGNSLKSESVKFTPMSAPENVKVSKDGVVSWTGGEGAAYYRVYKVYNGITKNAKTTSSPYTFQNLTEGVEHEIYVVAFDNDGNQYKSESVKFTPAKKAVLTAPTNVKIDDNGNVTWTAAENAAYYKVSKVVNGKTSTGKQVTGTKYTFQYLAKGQEHEIYVTAFDKDGNSVKSESIKYFSVTAPTNVKIDENGTVTWTAAGNAAYYRVYKVYNGITKSAKTNDTSYTFQNLAEGVEHEIYVVAYSDGKAFRSESVKFTPAKKAVLTAPTNVNVDADGNVTWTAAENAAYYKVSKVVNGKTSTGKQVTDTKYTFINFNPGQSKTVYVTAFDKDGNSVKSEAVTVKAVENITVTAKGKVTFDKVDGASYYRVYKVCNGVTKNAKTTALTYTFQSLTKGAEHDIYVKAYNASGKEIASSKTVTITAE